MVLDGWLEDGRRGEGYGQGGVAPGEARGRTGPRGDLRRAVGETERPQPRVGPGRVDPGGKKERERETRGWVRLLLELFRLQLGACGRMKKLR